jgi:hypothetical protein
MILSPNEMAFCLVQAGFSGIDPISNLPHVVVGVAVGLAESSGNTDALGKVTIAPVSGNFDHGWMQISNRWHGTKLQRTSDWRNPYVNAKLAKQVFDETVEIQKKKNLPLSGWPAWATFNSGSFKQWVPFAQLGAASPFAPTLANYQPEITVSAPSVTIDPTTIPLEVTVTTAAKMAERHVELGY